MNLELSQELRWRHHIFNFPLSFCISSSTTTLFWLSLNFFIVLTCSVLCTFGGLSAQHIVTSLSFHTSCTLQHSWYWYSCIAFKSKPHCANKWYNIKDQLVKFQTIKDKYKYRREIDKDTTSHSVLLLHCSLIEKTATKIYRDDSALYLFYKLYTKRTCHQDDL